MSACQACTPVSREGQIKHSPALNMPIPGYNAKPASLFTIISRGGLHRQSYQCPPGHSSAILHGPALAFDHLPKRAFRVRVVYKTWLGREIMMADECGFMCSDSFILFAGFGLGIFFSCAVFICLNDCGFFDNSIRKNSSNQPASTNPRFIQVQLDVPV